MVAGKDTVPRKLGDLRSCSIVTYSRYVNINWVKVGIIARKEHCELIAVLPRTFGKVRIRETGKLIGGIDIKLTRWKVIRARLLKSRQS